MRYWETREQSAELLRMTLPLMARHTAGFHPMSFAVWYEYVAGINPALRTAIDQRLAEGVQLSDEDILQLYAGHVAHRDIDASARMRTDIERLMKDVDGAALEAGQEVQQFGSELAQYRGRLEQGLSGDALGGMVRSLINDTTRMHASTELFQEHLRKSALEVERLRTALEEAQGLAQRDPITALLNRRGFDLQLVRLGREGPPGCCLLMLDIDNFKAINDSHGHLLGDKVIIAVANVLRGCVGERGSIARVGGDEFAVLLTQPDLDGAVELAERVRVSVSRGALRRANTDEVIGGVSVSIGVAERTEAEPLDAFIARADRALYESKARGRNCVTTAPGGAQDLA
jgi:diguanylate cyclase